MYTHILTQCRKIRKKIYKHCNFSKYCIMYSKYCFKKTLEYSHSCASYQMFLMHRFNTFGYLDMCLFDRERKHSAKFFSDTN